MVRTKSAIFSVCVMNAFVCWCAHRITSPIYTYIIAIIFWFQLQNIRYDMKSQTGVNHCSRAHTNVWENHNTFTANILTEFIVYYCCLVDNHLWFISEDNHRTQSVDFLLQTKHDSIEAALFLCNYADWVETAEPLKWYRWRQKKN